MHNDKMHVHMDAFLSHRVNHADDAQQALACDRSCCLLMPQMIKEGSCMVSLAHEWQGTA